MTSDELKKLLDARKELFSDSYGQDKNEPYMVGFENAVELLWPLVEALEQANKDYIEAATLIVSNPKGSHRGKNSGSICAEVYSFLREREIKNKKPLTELKEKLKGG